MREVHTPAVAKYQFNSLNELSRWIDDTPRTWGAVKQATSNPAAASWDLGAGYEGAVDMAREGWLEGAQSAEAVMATLPPKDAAPDTRTDFYGHLPHVARFCAGAPDSMIRYTRDGVSGSGRVLTLYVQINALFGTNAKCMSNFGLGVAQWVNDVEQRGIRVELWGVFVSQMRSGGVKKLSHAWRIKYADQPLDLAVLSFSIGHPAMFRRLGFALYERSKAGACSSYGVTVSPKLSDLIDPPAGSYVLTGMGEANRVAPTPKKAADYITAQLDSMLSENNAS